MWPYGLQPPRLFCPWDSSGKNTGVGCQALLQGIFPTQQLNPHMSPAFAGGFFIIKSHLRTVCVESYFFSWLAPGLSKQNVICSEQNKEKTLKRNEDSLWDLWDNIWIIGAQKKKRKRKSLGRYLKDYSWKLPYHGKGNSYPHQGSTKSPTHDKPNTWKHVLIKLTKIKYKEKY